MSGNRQKEKMSKSILVIDTPESCDICSFADMVNGKMYCGVPGCGELAENYIVCRPGWCPLRNLPKKKDLEDIAKHCGYSWQYANSEGFNACIDEILERENENEQET